MNPAVLFLSPTPVISTSKHLFKSDHQHQPQRKRRKQPRQDRLSTRAALSLHTHGCTFTHHHQPRPEHPLVITDSSILSRFNLLPITTIHTATSAQEQQQQNPLHTFILPSATLSSPQHTTTMSAAAIPTKWGSPAEVDVGLRLLTSWILGSVLARGLGGMFAVSLGVTMMLIFGSTSSSAAVASLSMLWGMCGVLCAGVVLWGVLITGGWKDNNRVRRGVVGFNCGVGGGIGTGRMMMVMAGICGVLCGGGWTGSAWILGCTSAVWGVVGRFAKSGESESLGLRVTRHRDGGRNVESAVRIDKFRGSRVMVGRNRAGLFM